MSDAGREDGGSAPPRRRAEVLDVERIPGDQWRALFVGYPERCKVAGLDGF